MQALSACLWGHMPARRLARAGRNAATRILTEAGAPAPPLSRVPGRELYLDNNQLTALPATVFNGLTKVGNIWVLNNQLSTLPATTFNGCTSLGQLCLAGNQLRMLPATIFDNLPSLTRIFLKCESFWSDSSCTTSGKDNPALTCTPLSQARIAALGYSGYSSGKSNFYKGPMTTCQYSSCTAGNAGPVGGTCAPCEAGFSPARPCIKRKTCMIHAD